MQLWHGVWGSAADDVWVVGSELGNDRSVLLHWDGSRWSPTTMDWGVDGQGALYGIGGTGPDDVWAVGGFGLTMHWDGAAWSVVTRYDSGSAQYNAVWAATPSDVWAVADNGIIARRR